MEWMKLTFDEFVEWYKKAISEKYKFLYYCGVPEKKLFYGFHELIK